MAPDAAGVQADMSAFLQNYLDGLSDSRSAVGGTAGWQLRALAAAAVQLRRWPLTRPAYQAIERWFVGDMLGSEARITCAVTTVSRIIDERGLPDIGLLKVDVERAEMDVLVGIRAEHWGRIRQVAMEVHADNLDDVRALLQGTAGFEHIAVQQSSDLKGTSIYNLYARRGTGR